MTKDIVRVGMGVFVLKDGKFLMQQRQGAHGEGTWALPGGHIEFGESFEDTARREVMEETGLEIKNIRFGGLTNDFFKDSNKHYITVWMLSDWASGQECINEPEKCAAQSWYSFDDLPSPLFLSWQQLSETTFMDAIKEELKVHGA